MALVATSPPPMAPPRRISMDVDRDPGRAVVFAATYASPQASPTKIETDATLGSSGSGSGASNVANAPTSPAREREPSSTSSSSAPAPAPVAPPQLSSMASARDDAQETGTLRRAKDLAAFTSLLPPAVEFVEGSSRGTLAAANLEGRYEPINASPKAGANGLPAEEEEEKKEDGGRGRSVNAKGVNGVDKSEHSPQSLKRSSRRDSTSDGQSVKSLYTDPIEVSWPNIDRPYACGLINLGNTCFLNSALQCLLHTPPLLTVLNDHTKGKCRVKNGFCASCSMHQIASDAYSKGRPFVPFAITKNLNAIAKHLRKGRQEDSHEFLRYLIDSMQKSCLAGYPPKIDHKLAETTWVHKIFGGRLRSRVTCQQCGYNSDTYDSILDLSIDIYGCDRLRDALKKFTAIDVLKGADKYKCEKCKRPVNAEKRFTIHDAPVVLTVHLKRFTPMGRKLQHPIRYDDRVTLQPYMSDGQFGPSYSLYGVISHAGGGPNSGHYYAHIRAANGFWYEMNDDAVERRGSALNMKNAYVLFYIREKGQALEAALSAKGVGVDFMRKRKEAPADDVTSPKRPALATSDIKLSTVPGPPTPKSNVEAELQRRKMDKIREEALKFSAAKTARTEPPKPRPLVDYGDESGSESEEAGEPVARPGASVVNGKAEKDDAPPAALTGGEGPSTPKEERDDERPGGADPPPSSPTCVPPTSSPPLPTPSTSPADTIAPSSFYGTKPNVDATPKPSVNGNALKRKSPIEDFDDDDDDGGGPSAAGEKIASAAPPRRSSYAGPGLNGSSASRDRARFSLNGGASPYSRGRLGSTLGAPSSGDADTGRGKSENTFLRRQRAQGKTYGGRKKFMM